MTNHEIYDKLQELLAHLADPCVDLENVGGEKPYCFFNEETQTQEFDFDRYYSRLIDSAIHAAADRCYVKADDKIFAKALKACKLKY
tara:strand:+ start:409 stop:669 length:261 start_codon:yes stop_codon:yes gene_type:complete